MTAVTFSHIGITVPDLERRWSSIRRRSASIDHGRRPTIKHDDSAIGQMCDDVFGQGWGSFRIAHLSTSDGIGIELFEFPQTEPEKAPFEYWRPGSSISASRTRISKARVKMIEQYGGRQRMRQVRYYYPGEKPYRMVYCEDPFGNIFETLQPLLRADLFGRRLRLRLKRPMAPPQGRDHRLRLWR